MNDSTLWWLVAGALVAAELATGTFYLLMVALGCVAGALAAHAGMSPTSQMVTAAVLGGGATAAWYFKRASQRRGAPAASNSDVNLDIGQSVHVDSWAADGTARVQYRGAAWSVRLAQAGAHRSGAHVIVAIHGSELQVAPATQH